MDRGTQSHQRCFHGPREYPGCFSYSTLNSSSQILVPLVEKFAEHLTAIDEAHDNQVCYPFASVTGVYALNFYR